MIMITNPARFDVVATENLFETSYLTNRASFLEHQAWCRQPFWPRPHVRCPIHGSAPDIAGQGISIRFPWSSAKDLRQFLEKRKQVQKHRRSVNQTLNQSLTRDLGGQASTRRDDSSYHKESLRWLGEIGCLMVVIALEMASLLTC